MANIITIKILLHICKVLVKIFNTILQILSFKALKTQQYLFSINNRRYMFLNCFRTSIVKISSMMLSDVNT